MKENLLALGGGDRVGGSSYLHDHGGHRFLVDCGAIQGDKGEGDTYPPFPHTSPDFIAITHDHRDHIGGLIQLMLAFPDVPVYATAVARYGFHLQAMDSVKIAREDQYREHLAGRTPAELLYDEDDVEACFRKISVVKSEAWFTPAPGYRMSFRRAGHKPGAAIILIVCPCGERIVHACDYCLNDMSLVRGAVVPEDFHNPDLLVTEGTYGNREIPDRDAEGEKLVVAVRRVLGQGGNVLIPHFATTAQEIGLILARAGIPSVLDGLAREYWSLYTEVDPWCEGHIPVTEQEKALITPLGECGNEDARDLRDHIKKSAKSVVIASSGRLEGGPSVGYAEAFLENPNNAIILPGYQGKAEEGKEPPQGRKLLQLHRHHDAITFRHDIPGKKPWNVTCKVNAEVIELHLSGHSDGHAMARWTCELNPQKVVVVHAEPEAQMGLKDRIYLLNRKITVVASATGQYV